MFHPRRRDRFRALVLRTPIWLLVAVYTLMFATLSLALYVVEPPSALHWADDFLISEFLGLLNAFVFLGLLAAVVIKVSSPPRDAFAFRPKLEVTSYQGGHALRIEYYVATALPVRDLQERVYVRTYEPEKESELNGEHPLRIFEIQPRMNRAPLPFAHTPTAFYAPVIVIGPTDKVPTSEEPRLILRREAAGGYSVANAGGVMVTAQGGQAVRLFVSVKGEAPVAGGHVSETKAFRLPEDIAADALPRMRAAFDPKRQRFRIKNWRQF